ncbi:lytic transglycosylase domain-containing protein [Desulfopila sp. IMCC35008]|uniref:lytic transglycosylase domain-containing protein n=1 Tax=Desulfopila sp. IMCC35008 TaxID=2653858 RepID=UPI0013D1FD99|nr:lytic transglycosylase domain-containing protein [Desulfopila sp. IMCC35008]
MHHHTKYRLLLFFIVLVVSGSVLPAMGQTVQLPITLEYPLLQRLVTNSAFPEPGARTTLVNEGNGCIYLALSEPVISEASGLVRLEMKITAQAGTPLSGSCFGSLSWQGFLVLYQQPYITGETWQLRFTTNRTELLGANRRPEQISQILWNFIEPRVIAYLDSLSVDLKVPVEDLKNFLLPLFPHQVAHDTEKMLDSMQPGTIDIRPDHIRVDILAEVEKVFDPESQAEPQYLAGADLEHLVVLWENWDSMLTHVVTLLARELLNADERQILVDVLLQTRHRFVEDLADKTITHDFVREQFVEAWQQLSPIFRNHLYDKKSNSQLLGYLAFVSSSDALLVFDKLGPTFGLEISRNGLIRLMQMLQADSSLLQYPQKTDPELQKLFQTNPQTGNIKAPLSNSSTFLESIFELFSPTTAMAAELPTFQEILKWQVPKKNIDRYIGRVDSVIQKALKQTIAKTIPRQQKTMFKQLIPALAWQESCYRQFVIRDNKLMYLLSYNQSSVGLMQVNERVWRGIYNRERLRWDINYNSRAGCKIAALYLTKYGLRDPKKTRTLTQPQMAGLVYAMYNGGPSQYSKYLARLKNKDFYQSDTLFNQKYKWVVSDQDKMLSKCLTGS